MSITIERERKWLLKRIPYDIKEDQKFSIHQFYKNDGWRYREEFDYDTHETRYLKLKKVRIGLGENQEVDITEITETEFYDEYHADGVKSISKDRYVFSYKGRKIEIDDFDELSLIIAEVEDVSMEDTVEFPPEIEKLILMEVTGNRKFDNFELAEYD